MTTPVLWSGAAAAAIRSSAHGVVDASEPRVPIIQQNVPSCYAYMLPTKRQRTTVSLSRVVMQLGFVFLTMVTFRACRSVTVRRYIHTLSVGERRRAICRCVWSRR